MINKSIILTALCLSMLVFPVSAISGDGWDCPDWYHNMHVSAQVIEPARINFNNLDQPNAPTDIKFDVGIVNCGCGNEENVSLIIQETSTGNTLYYNPDQLPYSHWLSGEHFEISIPISDLTPPPAGNQWVDMGFVVTVLQKDWQLDYDLSNNMRTVIIKAKPPRK